MGKTFVGVKMIGNSEQNLSVYSTQQGIHSQKYKYLPPIDSNLCNLENYI